MNFFKLIPFAKINFVKNCHQITIMFICIFISSCINREEEVIETFTENIYDQVFLLDKELFEKANDQIAEGNYDLAIETLDKLEVVYPNSEFSEKSRLLTGYIYFLKGEYEKTRTTAENFIKYYPGNENLVYAYYLDALTYYILIKEPEYDQFDTVKALNKLTFIQNAFPESEYDQDILIKINVLNNTYSEHLLSLGNYYYSQGLMLPALQYYLQIYNEYSQYFAVEEALLNIVKIYLSIEEEALAIKYASILGYNFSESKSYEKAYKLIKKIDQETQVEKWYEKFNPKKLFRKKVEENEKKWYEPKKPKFKLF